MDSKLLQETVSVIKELYEENKLLTEKLAVYKQAEQLAIDMLKKNLVAVEDLESVLSDLSNKSLKELEIIKLAKDYSNYSPESPFKLSSNDTINSSNLDPITRMLLEDI